MMGIETDSAEKVLSSVKHLLRAGVIVLPDGPLGDVLALTPPFSITQEEIEFLSGLIQKYLA